MGILLAMARVQWAASFNLLYSGVQYLGELRSSGIDGVPDDVGASESHRLQVESEPWARLPPQREGKR